MKIKRIFATVLIMGLFASSIPGLVFAASQHTARFTIGSDRYVIDGASKNMDVAPCIIADRTYLPIKYVAEALGLSGASVKWDPGAQTITIDNNGDVIEFIIGSNIMKKNGSVVQMDVAPMILSGRTMVPLKWAVEGLNAQVSWDSAANAATITSNDVGSQETSKFKLEEVVWEYQAQSKPCKINLLPDGRVNVVDGSLSGLSWDIDGNIPILKKDGTTICRFEVLIPWQDRMMFLGEYEPDKNITCVLREIK